jgi:predicted 3-demethylubiquinone-9 3-methyltransferase (glyoxalase superfamily)
MPSIQKVTPCLWFDHQAEEAAGFYVSIFKNSKIGDVARYTEAGQEVHGRPPGSAMTVAFQLDGQDFLALNGGPVFKFSEAISLVVNCDSQAEVDYYWEKLIQGGDPEAQQCGWLKDRYGVSWQVVPTALAELMSGTLAGGPQRAMEAMLKMKKLDIEQLRLAYEGSAAAAPQGR